MADEKTVIDDDDEKEDASETDDTAETEEDTAITALKANSAKMLKELKAARQKARELEAKEAEREAALAEKEEESARKKGDFEKIETRLKSEVEKHQAEATTWKAKYESKVIGDALREGLEAVNVKTEFRKVLTNHFDATLDVEIDEEGKVTVAGQDVGNYLKAWAKTDEGKAYIASGNNGGGANGSGQSAGGVNPWAKETWNLTQQGQIVRADKTKAIAMAKAAGAVPPA